MSFILDGTTIRRPIRIDESNSTQYAQQRALDGTISRDYMGDNKRKWTLDYEFTNPTDYNTIKAIYDAFQSTAEAVTWESTESSYTISETTVHVDLEVRAFNAKGSDYISDFTLILTED